MFSFLTNWRRRERRSQSAHLNLLQPDAIGPATEWYEAALCELDEETGKLAIVKIRRALEPEITFSEDDGIVPGNVYTTIFRKFEIDEEHGILWGEWSEPTGWRKPHIRSEQADALCERSMSNIQTTVPCITSAQHRIRQQQSTQTRNHTSGGFA